jgi:cell wall-associated NlpC family hydrolase
LKQLSALIILLLVASCKTQSTLVITSKKEAIKKNQYDYNVENRLHVIEAKMKEQKAVANKKAETHPIEVIKVVPNKPIILDQGEEDVVISTEDASYFCEQLINNAIDNLGSRYQTGGISKDGFDCSGLMYYTFKKFDIILPRTSTDMAKIGRVMERSEVKKGDLIFFRTNGKNHINHVGMVVEVTDEEIVFVHSSTSKGVIYSSTKENYYGKNFAQVNRVIE